MIFACDNNNYLIISIVLIDYIQINYFNSAFYYYYV